MGCCGAGRLGVGCPRWAGVTGAEEEGGSGARVSGCCVAELRRRIEWLWAGKAQEQEIRGPEGVLSPCHGGGEVAAGGRFGWSWRVQQSTVERGNRTGIGGEWRVEADQAGGGAAATAQRRRWGALHQRQRGQSRGTEDARGGRRKGGPRDLFGNFKNLRDPTVK
jgi:hypothetical protein